ncbi:hypothetical protein [Novosphingobium sp. B1]|uniref:hypothetical protein n=1 Tax=Novosphingobium sp. B1 TaxID=1938756 RepID=UPI0009D82DA0|nr:hypothetical protein [Novosphingobium sp. B1]SMC97174.1 hypothetical protein SAMN06272759_11515 [Novosphingobium sp. B1]
MSASAWSGKNPSDWAEQTDRLLTALLRNSVQDLAQVAAKTIPEGGNVPVKTGNLARSVVVDNKPPTVIEGLATGDYSLGIANIKPGETVYVGWQAAYSRRMNYGFVGADSLGRVYNQAGFGFAEAAAAQWPAIVARQAAALGGK